MLNLGQTCFLNVILQCFIHNPLLRNYFLGDRHNTRLCKHTDCTCCEMDSLFSEVSDHSMTILQWLFQRPQRPYHAKQDLGSDRHAPVSLFFSNLVPRYTLRISRLSDLRHSSPRLGKSPQKCQVTLNRMPTSFSLPCSTKFMGRAAGRRISLATVSSTRRLRDSCKAM